MKKTPFDHWSNECDCFKKHKDQSFKDEFWICDNHLFFKSFQWNVFNEGWVWSLPAIGLWFTLLLCFRQLLLLKFLYLYSQINIIIKETILLWLKKIVHKICHFINGSILVFLWSFSSNIFLIGQHGVLLYILNVYTCLLQLFITL